MMRWKLGLVFAAAMLAGVGCKKKNNANEIVIGEFASMSGDTATFGISSHNGLMLALDEINASGGILGKKVRIVTEDDRSDQNEAVSAVQKLINSDDVAAVIGEVASTRSLAGATVCQREQVPMLSPASTNPAVTMENGKVRPWIFRICFTDEFQGKIDGTFATQAIKDKPAWKRVAVMTNIDQDYSKGLSRFFHQAYKGSGTVVAEEQYSKRDVDFKAQLNRIRTANPDAVYVPGYYTEVTLILPQAKQVGLDVPFFGGDGWDSSQTLAMTESQGDYYSDHFSAEDPSGPVQKFVKAYSAKYKETPDAMAVLGYDAGRVMFDAIRRAGSTNKTAIRDALGQTKDFPGASGSITIDRDHNARKPIVLLKIDNHKATVFKTYPPEE
jgi:branched-chain amino acid transport system substrate-binding protein